MPRRLKMDIEEGNKPVKQERLKNYILYGAYALTLAVLIATVVSILVTQNSKTDKNTTTDPLIQDQQHSKRLDCLPELSLYSSENDEKLCKEQPNCIYDPKSTPKCYYDVSKLTYKLLSKENTNLGERYIIQSNQDVNKKLSVDFEYLTSRVVRFKITIYNSNRYEVPIPIKKVDVKADNPSYTIEIQENPFNFKIVRKNTQTAIWDSSIGGLIFEDQQIQIATNLPSKNLYGFGDNNHRQFRHDLNYKSWPVFGRDQNTFDVSGTNLYGVQPFYTCMEDDGQSHGILLVNSNAFEYEFLPAPGLVYRITGGILDFYAFLGPEPENVIQQYTEFVGRPMMPAYWALGFQVSRYGYKDIQDMRNVVERFEKYKIPLDTQVADIDHMDERKDFTIDPVNFKDIDKYFDELHTKNLKTIIILDPALVVNYTDYEPYNRGKAKGVFMTWPDDYKNPDFNDTNSQIILGYCWPRGKVAYPDFFKNSTQDWWIDEIKRHYQLLKFDGLWIDMNEPAVFGTNEERPFNWPEKDKPYWSLKCPDDKYETVRTKASWLHKKNNKLSDKTLCMIARQGNRNEYMHYDVHNMYGYTETIPSYKAAQLVTGKRSIVISRSTFIGSGQYTGHWTGDNESTWGELFYSIIGMLEFNLFGIPYVGSDICGFFKNTTAQLCQRWQQVGAFFPFSRNHNGEGYIHQDPGVFGEEVAKASREALLIRYEILPFYYTLFYKAHTKGNTVIRALFHEYPRETETYGIDKQFLVGSSILISPALEENQIEVNAYFGHDQWYSFYDGKALKNPNGTWVQSQWTRLSVPLDHIPVHIRGGHIIPTQDPALNTVESRKNPFGLIVALNDQGEAEGDLFYDDGETIDWSKSYYYATFSVRENTLIMNIEHNTYNQMNNMVLDKIRIFSSQKNVYFTLNGAIFDISNVKFNENEIILTKLGIRMDKGFELRWFDYDIGKFNFELPLIDCSVENRTISQNDCIKRKCRYIETNTDKVPKCTIPRGMGGYTIESSASQSYTLKKADDFTLFGKESPRIRIDFSRLKTKQSNGFNFLRVKISDPSTSRYEVPLALDYETSSSGQFSFDVSNSAPNSAAFIEVRSNNNLLFDTRSIEQGLIFSDQYIQLVLNLYYKNAYGFGENTHNSYKHKFEYSHFYPIFARDQPPGDSRLNLYGTQPFLMAINDLTGRAFGLLILNSNAMEYGFLPRNAFSYRTLGGLLDLYIFEEASPELVIQAYTSLIGRPYLPPYWSLGFQLCRYGYNNIENLIAAVNRTRDALIPHDVQYADIDHFEKQLDFTYDKVNFKGLPEYIRYLNSTGIRFIIILDPAINSEVKNYLPFESGTKDDIWIKWPTVNNPQKDEMQGNNQYMLGYVWPEGKTVFPDFFKESTKKWWQKEIVAHFKNVQFDGLWIDMNEPANFDTNEVKPWNWPENRPPWNLFCNMTDSPLDNPPYLPLAARPYGNTKMISDKTLCMIGTQNDGKFTHYDVHNLYGWSQTEPTLVALREATNLRGIVISRSTYPSSGTMAGHWLGDNTSQWTHLKQNIIGLLEFNLFGIPYIGADICGFFGDATPEMCQRWMQMGAFNTFYRNHNGFNGIDQDPGALGPQVAHASKEITEIRYSLLPYLYTLFYLTNLNGGTVIRSLGHEFPADLRALNIDRQFLWGSSLLISPVLDINKRTVVAYFPNSRWFDFYNGKEIEETIRAHELDAPLDHLLLHVRGGSILVTQKSALNTRQSRLNNFGLLIAPNETNEAIGDLYWDGGEEINPINSSSFVNFFYSNGIIRNTVVKNLFDFSKTNQARLETIRVFGVDNRPKSITVDQGGSINSFTYNSLTKVRINF